MFPFIGTCRRAISIRSFHTSLRRLNQQEGSIPLALDPASWKGLPSEEIFKLYNERLQLLGPDYRRSEDELEALLTTSKDTGFTYSQIKQIYEEGDEAAEAIEKTAVDEVEGMANDDTFDHDDYTKFAHILVDEHREQRQFNRIAAFEMPLLTKFKQEYKRPDHIKKPIQYRYTTYIGESHPAERKVVATFKVSDLKLGERELHKFKLLSGVHYDYTTDQFKLSSERFPEPAQNARFISDTLNKLIKESKDLTDDFSDVPLDTRHIKLKLYKKKQRRLDAKFPEEWKRPQDATVDKLFPDFLLD